MANQCLRFLHFVEQLSAWLLAKGRVQKMISSRLPCSWQAGSQRQPQGKYCGIRGGRSSPSQRLSVPVPLRSRPLSREKMQNNSSLSSERPGRRVSLPFLVDSCCARVQSRQKNRRGGSGRAAARRRAGADQDLPGDQTRERERSNGHGVTYHSSANYRYVGRYDDRHRQGGGTFQRPTHRPKTVMYGTAVRLYVASAIDGAWHGCSAW